MLASLWRRNNQPVPLSPTHLYPSPSPSLHISTTVAQKQSIPCPAMATASLCGRWVDGEVDLLCRHGLLDKALNCLSQLSCPPSHDAYISLLKTCAKQRNLSYAMCVYAHIIIVHSVIPLNQWLGEHLVVALAKCGSPNDALFSLLRLQSRTLVSWTAVICCFVDHGLWRDALLMYEKMLEDGIRVDSFTFSSLFRACGNISDLEHGRKLHADARIAGFSSDIFIGNILITMYRKCGSTIEAEEVFSELPSRDAISWNSMLSAYVNHGEGEKALLLYRQMREEHVPSQQSLVMALQACGMLANRDEGNAVKWRSCRIKYLDILNGLHMEARRNGLVSHPVLGTTLLTMYGKCGTINEAEFVSGGLSYHDIVSLTAMLSAYVHQCQGKRALQLYRKMLMDGFNPDSKAFAVALQACGSISPKENDSCLDPYNTKMMSFDIVKALHNDAWRKGYAYDVALGSILVNIYGKCGSIGEAEGVFCALAHRDFTTWTSMMSAYIEQGQGRKALLLYRQMREEGVKPDHQTIVTALQACGLLAEDEEPIILGPQSIKVKCFNVGRALHADARSEGFLPDSFVFNALVSLYGKCGAIVDAENVFSSVEIPDALLWVRMLSAFLELGQAENALQSFKLMQAEGMETNPHTFLIAVQACGILAQKEDTIVMEGRSVKLMGLEIGQALLIDAQKRNLHLDVYVATALVNLLGKCGSVEDAEMVCMGLLEPDIVLLTSLLSVYVEQGQGEKALDVYGQMRNNGMFVLDDITLVCVLQACAKTGNLELSRELHFTTTYSSYSLSCYLASALVYAYGSCASSMDVKPILDGLIEPDLVTWNACVASYAGEGNLIITLQMAQEMQLSGSNPDEVTFVSLISASSHAGLIYQGLEFFESMGRDYCVTPDLKHYGTILDLLGRAGDFPKLQCVVRILPSQTDLATWLCLLGACRIHGNVELAKLAFDSAVRLQPKEAAPYILMSKIYIDSGLPHLAEEVDKLRPQCCKETSWLESD